MKSANHWANCYNWTTGQTEEQLEFQVRQVQADALRHAAAQCRDNHGTASLTAKRLDTEAEQLEAGRSRPEPPDADWDR